MKDLQSLRRIHLPRRTIVMLFLTNLLFSWSLMLVVNLFVFGLCVWIVLIQQYCGTGNLISCKIFSLVIGQKGETQNGCFKKTKQAKFSERGTLIPSNTHTIRTLLPPYTYVCVSGRKKCLFFGKFGMLCFLEIPVFRFALLPYYRCFLEACY